MKKILAASLCALLSMGLLLSCNEKGEKKVNLIYSVNAVPGDAHYDAMMKFKEVVEAESKGNITVETYHSGSLFKQDQEVAAVKSGKADIVYLSASWLTDGSP